MYFISIYYTTLPAILYDIYSLMYIYISIFHYGIYVHVYYYSLFNYSFNKDININNKIIEYWHIGCCFFPLLFFVLLMFPFWLPARPAFQPSPLF